MRVSGLGRGVRMVFWRFLLGLALEVVVWEMVREFLDGGKEK